MGVEIGRIGISKPLRPLWHYSVQTRRKQAGTQIQRGRRRHCYTAQRFEHIPSHQEQTLYHFIIPALPSCSTQCETGPWPNRRVRFVWKGTDRRGKWDPSMTITWENGQTMETHWPGKFFDYYFSGTCQGKTSLEIENEVYREARAQVRYRFDIENNLQMNCCAG